jgi:hypothetical protein
MANPKAILTALCLGLQIGVSQAAFAQGSYPSRAVTIINPFTPAARRTSSCVDAGNKVDSRLAPSEVQGIGEGAVRL